MIGGSPIPVERFIVASEMTETVGHFVILRPAEAIIGAYKREECVFKTLVISSSNTDNGRLLINLSATFFD